MYLANTAEGQDDGTVVTNANSGGTSGDAFSACDPANSAITFSSTSPAMGSRCYKVADGTGSLHMGGWDADTLGAGYSSLSARFWFKTPADAPSGDGRICTMRNASTYSGLMWGGTAGTYDNTIYALQGSSGISGSKSGTLSFSTWYLLDLAILRRVRLGSNRG